MENENKTGMYRKRPIPVHARQFHYCAAEDFLDDPVYEGMKVIKAKRGEDDLYVIDTLEGWMEITDGDFIIRGVRGEYYPCKEDIFRETYEEIETSCGVWPTISADQLVGIYRGKI